MPDSFNSIDHAVDFLKHRKRFDEMYPFDSKTHVVLRVKSSLNTPAEIEACRYLIRRGITVAINYSRYNP